MSAYFGSRMTAATGLCTSAFLLLLSVPPASAQTITACVGKNGQTQLVDATTPCKNGDTRTTWSVQGPKGDKGDKGDPGPEGPKGDPGTPPTGRIIGRIVGCGVDGVIGISQATFGLLGYAISGFADTDGTFAIDAPPGTYRLGPPPLSSGPITVTAGQTTDLGDLQLTNFMTNPFNCGACGIRCGEGSACVAGICTTAPPPPVCVPACGPDQSCVAGICVSNPPACVPACTGASQCIGGVCVPPPCLPGQISCGGTCVSTATDVNHCGGCNLSCGQGQACVNGLCAGGPTLCSGNGTFTNGFCVCNTGFSGPNCEIPPPPPSCTDGIKNGLEGDVDCGGACPNRCAVGSSCLAQLDCQGAPNSTVACVTGTCTITSCAPTAMANCDGNGANGCETNTATDIRNCGGCQLQCVFPNAAAQCVNGFCAIGSCNSGFSNCDNNLGNGCETFGSCLPATSAVALTTGGFSPATPRARRPER